MQTLDEVKANNGTVTEMIAEINNSVVGISKVKNSGSGIFSDENISSLGLGTGFNCRRKWIYSYKCTCERRKV